MATCDPSSHACIFTTGCKDSSTKESRISRELEELSKIRKNNPHKVVLNRRGKTAPVKSKENRSGPIVQKLPPAYITTLLKTLRQNSVLHNGRCKHNIDRVNEAMRLVYGTGGHGSAEIATEYDIGPETVVAAYAGYYIVDGETVFLHSDGSICRIPQSSEAVRCPCNAIHG